MWDWMVDAAQTPALHWAVIAAALLIYIAKVLSSAEGPLMGDMYQMRPAGTHRTPAPLFRQDHAGIHGPEGAADGGDPRGGAAGGGVGSRMKPGVQR